MADDDEEEVFQRWRAAAAAAGAELPAALDEVPSPVAAEGPEQPNVPLHNKFNSLAY